MAQRQQTDMDDKAAKAARKKAVQSDQPQHHEGPFAAKLDLGNLDQHSVGRLQRTVGNKATSRIIQRKSALEEKIMGGSSKGGSSQIPKSAGDEGGTLKDMISGRNQDKAKPKGLSVPYDGATGGGKMDSQGGQKQDSNSGGDPFHPEVQGPPLTKAGMTQSGGDPFHPEMQGPPLTKAGMTQSGGDPFHPDMQGPPLTKTGGNDVQEENAA